MVTAEFPAPLDVEVQFWRYTLRDFGRIGVPALVGWGLAGYPGLLLGGLVGVGLAEITVREKHVDEHVVDTVRFQLGTAQAAWPEVDVRSTTVVRDDGTVIGVVRVSGVDLDMAADATKRASRKTVYDLVKKLESPVEVQSRQRHVDLSAYQGATETAVVTDHFVVVRAQPTVETVLPWRDTAEETTVDDRVASVEERCSEIRATLTAGDLHAAHVTGDELQDVVERLNVDDWSLSRRRYAAEQGAKPHRRLLYVTEYPAQVRLGWLADVLNTDTPGLVETVQAIDPVTEDQRDWMDRILGRLRSELAREQRPTREVELERKRDDLVALTEAEASGDERLVNYGVYIVARGATADEVDATVDAVTSVLRRYRIEFREPVLQTHRAVKTESLLHRDALGKTLIVPGRSAAAGFSFSTQDAIAPGGTVIGQDTRNGMPVIVDRFSWEAPHIAKMGKTGSGKTYQTALELLRAYDAYDDLRIRVIDPKPDYGAIVDALDGETVVLDEVNLDELVLDSDVARFVVADPARDTADLLTDAVRYVHREGYGDDRKTLVVIDEAHRLLERGGSDGVAAVETLIREGREWQLGVTLVTQSAEDFTATQAGRNILRNVDCSLFLKHEALSNDVPQFFRLSREEATALQQLRTGTDLPFSEAVIRGPVNTRLRIDATDHEHALITRDADTDPDIESMSTDATTTDAQQATQDTPADNDAHEQRPPSQTDGGTTTRARPHEAQSARDPSWSETHRRPGSPRAQGPEPPETVLELPDTCVTEREEPDVDAPAVEMLPDVLPGWERQKTDAIRWRVPVAEDWVVGTYVDARGGRYMVHVSRWAPEHVQYAIDELFGIGEPTRFDVWTARGRFVYGVKIASGTVRQARVLLTACPALSTAYLNELMEGEHS